MRDVLHFGKRKRMLNLFFTLPAALNKGTSSRNSQRKNDKKKKKKEWRPFAGLFLRRYKIVPGVKIESPTFCGVETNGPFLIGHRLQGRRSGRLIDKLIDYQPSKSGVYPGKRTIAHVISDIFTPLVVSTESMRSIIFH